MFNLKTQNEVEQRIYTILKEVIHPELNVDIVEAGMVESVTASQEGISVVITFPKSHDPFMKSIQKRARQLLVEEFAQMEDKIFVLVKEAPPKARKKIDKERDGAANIKRIIAVASGKGGVGKSTVTSNLAVVLAKQGYKVGVLDADIYGPSQPRMFGLEGYLPESVHRGGKEYIVPAVAHGVKVMSIGFFISPSDALIWRGPMATNALRQLIHQTEWGELDYLLVDLPPGTGDVHLTILQEMNVSGALIVTTPQKIALDDAIRGIEMFRAPKIEVPIVGVIENMAWFTPAELPNNRYYIFGRGGAELMARQQGLILLGQIPIIQSVMEGAEGGTPASRADDAVAEYYQQTAKTIVEKLG